MKLGSHRCCQVRPLWRFLDTNAENTVAAMRVTICDHKANLALGVGESGLVLCCHAQLN